MKNFLKRLFCFHPALQSVDAGDYKVEYSSPWSIMGTKVRKWHCSKCNSFYYRTGYHQSELEVNERFIKLLTNRP